MVAQNVIYIIFGAILTALIGIVAAIASIVLNKFVEPIAEKLPDVVCKTMGFPDYSTAIDHFFQNRGVVNTINSIIQIIRFIIKAVPAIIFFGIIYALFVQYQKIPVSLFRLPQGVFILLCAVAVIFALILLLKKSGLLQTFCTNCKMWTQNHKKWILGIIFLGIVLLVAYALDNWGSELPLPSEPIDGGHCGEHVEWELYNDGTLKISGAGYMKDYLHDGRQEDEDKKEPAPWWSRRDEIRQVEIACSIQGIGSGAFSGCGALESVSFFDVETGTKTVESQINVIGDYAFYGCVSLKTADIPPGVWRIEENTFKGCSQLESVSLPKGLNAIGHGAFSDCKNLTQIVIPESVQYIGQSAFKNCGLRTLEIRINAVPEGTNDEKEHFIRDFPCLKNEKSSLKSTDFPSPYTSNATFPFVGPEAFRNCKSLESVTFQNSTAVRIGESAFQGCVSLSEIDLPASVWRFDPYAFEGCENLESLTIPGGKSKRPFINQSAFENCLRLKRVQICGENITINPCAFSGCGTLKEIVFPDMPENKSLNWRGKLTIKEKAFSGCGQLSAFPFPYENCTIGKYAFENCSSLKKAKLSKGMEIIEEAAFSGCDNLKEIELPDTITAIKNYAFSHCIALEDVPLSGLKNLVFIGKWAFSGCSALTEVTIPDGVKTLGENAFARSKKMVSDSNKRLEISASSELRESGQVKLAAPCADISSPQNEQAHEGE